MRWINLFFIGLMCCLCAACLTQTLPQVVQPTLVQPSPVQVEATQKGFQYYATFYQQWIILGVYVLTTLIMAFYTRKQDKKKAERVKKVADTLLVSKAGKPGVLLRLLRLLFKGRRK